jgi:hypothetical protein
MTQNFIKLKNLIVLFLFTTIFFEIECARRGPPRGYGNSYLIFSPAPDYIKLQPNNELPVKPNNQQKIWITGGYDLRPKLW